MSYLKMDAILQRLRNGISMLSQGEQRTILNYLVDQVDELKQQVESLRGPESSSSPKKEDTGNRVRRGRKPKQDSGETSSTAGDD